MKKLPLLIILFIVGISIGFAVTQSESASNKVPTFEDVLAIIKKYEGMHSSKHWPLIGYGHKVMPGEKYTRGKVLSESEADALARKDLAKLCAIYRSYGPDSLILAALAYNCGIGVVAKSSVLAKLKAGNRDIEASYLAHSKYKGKTLAQLKRRRQEEFEALFVKDPSSVMHKGPTETAHVATTLSLDESSQNSDSIDHVSHHNHSNSKDDSNAE